ncbi:MAG: peptidoglycan DD-metalloendopeptidase family protein [Pseudomonadota bacterium]
MASSVKSIRAVGVLLLALGFLTGCGSSPPAPIVDHSAPGASERVSRYVVLRGDTLYSIAFRYGLEFRRLAAANSIGAPYTIYPGQTLVLAEADVPAAVVPVKRAAAPPSSTSKASSSSSTRTKPTVKPTTTTPTPASNSTSTAAKGSAATSSSTSQANKPANVAVSRWQWPASGPVLRRFDGELRKGIDIGGSRGDPVKATAGGQVVYAGTAIAGYGLMLIVRHNDEYLSAYGHNDSLLVAEGDTVRAGQQVATRGSSGTDAIKLHFEIRRRGRPVDPLSLLPRR